MSDLIITIILGIIEGITEFLPVSSTGHLIVATALLNPSFDAVTAATFNIFIQFGAVLAMIVFYRAELVTQVRTVRTDKGVQRFWLAIAIAFVPAAIVGVLARGFIKEVLFNPMVVAVMLVTGGILLIVVERIPALTQREHTSDTSQITVKQAVIIGVAQCFAYLPGMSRSAMSIVGGMVAGLDRQAATRFSFFLAIPTLGLATLADFVLSLDEINPADLPYFLIGAVAAFFAALITVRWLLRYVSGHSYVPFGIYRIVVGILIVVLFATLIQ
ncbi:MAG: undecaprenyl-diphosphate phosphatase [Anaerolineae bacterium]